MDFQRLDFLDKIFSFQTWIVRIWSRSSESSSKWIVIRTTLENWRGTNLSLGSVLCSHRLSTLILDVIQEKSVCLSLNFHNLAPFKSQFNTLIPQPFIELKQSIWVLPMRGRFCGKLGYKKVLKPGWWCWLNSHTYILLFLRCSGIEHEHRWPHASDWRNQYK